MRLRKYTLKTQAIDDSPNKNKLKSSKRLRTQLSQSQNLWFKSQKCVAHKNGENNKFKRFSGQIQFIQPKRGSKKIKTFDELLEWRKTLISPESKKHSIDRMEQVQEIDVLKSHLDNIGQKPKKMHRRMHTQPNLHIKESRKVRDRTAQVPMDRVKYAKCCDIVDDIYNKISILKEIGYADDKINAWVLSFCDMRRPFMKSILMRNVTYSVYVLKEEFQYEKEVRAVKDRIKYQIHKNKDEFNYIQISQLREFSHYLQDILIQKNTKKAREVQQSIVQKLSMEMMPRVKNDFCVFTKTEPTAVYNFIEELSNFQSKYGDFYSFSKINKLRFLQLTKVEKKLKNIYKDLLQCQIKKFSKSGAQNKSEKLLKTVEISSIQ